MATYYEANLTSVVPGLSNLFTSTDKVADRLLKAKNAMGVEVVKGKNVIAGEDFPVKEPLLSKLSVCRPETAYCRFDGLGRRQSY